MCIFLSWKSFFNSIFFFLSPATFAWRILRFAFGFVWETGFVGFTIVFLPFLRFFLMSQYAWSWRAWLTHSVGPAPCLRGRRANPFDFIVSFSIMLNWGFRFLSQNPGCVYPPHPKQHTRFDIVSQLWHPRTDPGPQTGVSAQSPLLWMRRLLDTGRRIAPIVADQKVQSCLPTSWLHWVRTSWSACGSASPRAQPRE